MRKETKVWGTTTELLKNSFVEVHRAEILKGGTCSEHIHQFKVNAFYVESGQLLIRKFQESGIVDETILQKGDITEVMPNIKHQFVGLDNCVVYEVYYPIEIGSIDIVRFSKGFLKDDSSSDS